MTEDFKMTMVKDLMRDHYHVIDKEMCLFQ